ncbi:hypothetical protein [Draconibacterium orientale]|uniref:hypothetical protein n=1 Tax=Draconibacterium orientale TaxID=1168034 RepID=UPI002ABE767F|nr:hypothetical protein [Draconibacterium orientale]
MRKLIITSLANSIILLPLILIYCWLVNESSLYNWILTFITIIILIFCIAYFKAVKIYFRNSSLERFISLVGLEIAVLAFIQTNVQFVKSNEQFETNRISSEKLFEKQLEHSEKLNQLQIDNTKKLNDTLTNELIRLQKINIKQGKSAENQLIATKSQLELSEQTLQDYLFDTKPELSIESTKITNSDTLENLELQLTISSVIKNMGRREADSVEIRNAVIFKDKSIGILSVSKEIGFFTGNRAIQNHHYPIMSEEMSKEFYYWMQVRYFDKKTGNQFDKSFYFKYYESARGYDFYFAKSNDKRILRDIIDKELTEQNLSLTIN